jgi:hypothetical protein
MLIDMREHPFVRHLRPKWTLSRWSAESKEPLFGLYLLAQDEAVVGALARGAA